MTLPIWTNADELAWYLEGVVRDISENPLDSLGERYRYRNVWNPENLNEIYSYIDKKFKSLGYETEEMAFEASFGYRCKKPQTLEVKNLIVEIPGTSNRDEIIVLGAHYDSRTAMKGDNEDENDLKCQRARLPKRNFDKTKSHMWNTPGANDNGSGVAALLALASAFQNTRFNRTLRFVAWVNEEFPFYANHYREPNLLQLYRADGMGSYRHAKRCAEKEENILCAISMDTMGCYYDDSDYEYKGKNLFDRWLIEDQEFPKERNYVALLSDYPTRDLASKFRDEFNVSQPEVRAISRYPGERISNIMKKKGAWSDDWSYWQFDYPGFIVTDLAYIRSIRYHRQDDTAEHMNFPKLADVVMSLQRTLSAFLNREF
ncbi:M28 family peptidase [bacterium]|nr:M28 family peptidase [bacterium]